ncbi:MAG: Sec-independent protein translocase subunit TatA [Gammaproteobacteria bacterium]|nr:Sec-independent protein translocase subunit TatA [Gammaproteobacteria bacterium]
MGGISIWQLIIILAIVLVLFGAKRLRTLGSDVGSAVKGFRSAMKEGEEEAAKKVEEKEANRVIDVEISDEKKQTTEKEKDRV